MKFHIKSTKTTFQILGYYQILGGVIGILHMSRYLIRLNEISGPILFIFLLTFFLFGFSIQSGGLLLLDKKLKKGLIFSIANHILQLFSFGLGGFNFGYYSGIRGLIGFDFADNYEFNLNFGISGVEMGINTGEAQLFFYVNIVALLILSLLINLYNELKKNDFELINS